MSQSQGQQQFNPLQELSERIKGKTSLREKLSAVFDVVHGQILRDAQAAKSKGSAAEAASVFEQHAQIYGQQREDILDLVAD
jgi:hypothetical protein